MRKKDTESTQQESSEITAAANEVNSLHRKFCGVNNDGLQLAIQIGAMLTTLKPKVQKTLKLEWSDWCEESLQMSQTNISNYMRVAKAQADGKLKGVEGLTEAIEALRKTGTRKDTCVFKPTISKISAEAAMEWLGANQKVDYPTLKVTAITASTLNRAMAEALKGHAKELEKSHRAVVIVELALVPEATQLKETTASAPVVLEPAPELAAV